MTTYHRTGVEALQDLKTRLEVGLLGFLAYRAGRNHYNVHGDLEEAVIYGAHALRRWWIWLFFVKVWIFSTCFLGWMLYLRFHDIRGESFVTNSSAFDNVTYTLAAFLLPALLGLLVLYCRNVDYSLFKRRFVYRVLRPLVVVLDRVPAWGLYLIVPCALFFPTGWFIDGEPVRESDQIAAVNLCRDINTARATGDTTYEVSDILADRVGLGDDLQGWYSDHC